MHVVPKASPFINYMVEMTGLIVSGTVRIQRLGVACWEGELSSVPLLVPPTDSAAPIHSPLQPDRKARQSKNIRWNFITPWQHIWLAWQWLNHQPFIFPWLCKSSFSRFSRLCFCRSQKQGASMYSRRKCPWPLIITVPSPELFLWSGHTMLIYLSSFFVSCHKNTDPTGITGYHNEIWSMFTV